MKYVNQAIRKVDAMKAQGVEFCTGVNVGVDVTAGELTSQYDASSCA